MRSKWINRVLSVALLFTTLTASVSYTFTTAYAEEAGASTQQSAQSGVSWPEAPEISAGNGILIDADTFFMKKMPIPSVSLQVPQKF